MFASGKRGVVVSQAAFGGRENWFWYGWLGERREGKGGLNTVQSCLSLNGGFIFEGIKMHPGQGNQISIAYSPPSIPYCLFQATLPSHPCSVSERKNPSSPCLFGKLSYSSSSRFCYFDMKNQLTSIPPPKTESISHICLAPSPGK